MKYQWEAQDVVAGRKVDSHNRAERYMIGYDASINSENGNLLLVSLRDGMLVEKGVTAEALAQRMNESGMRAVCIREDDIAAARKAS
ncbi:TPA: hypothetical protein RJN57_000626 [Pseudomonas aeruginosa]|jgi:hypothetical protein|nr:hypothetical protein [Pseudomonas aeruginosa]HDV6144000.1 hypothetical protein [Pseudomonas aeruginosa]HDV6168227.1 hypothetical protein [Pseudomonas aeruginosa]